MGIGYGVSGMIIKNLNVVVFCEERNAFRFCYLEVALTVSVCSSPKTGTMKMMESGKFH